MGGPAKLLTPYIKEYFNLNCTYLKNYQVANAIGAALSKITGEINLHIDTHKGDLIIPELSLIEKINRETNLVDAKKIALKYLSNLMKEKGYENEDDLEIVFASSFNMISGFYTKGKNIRVTAQVRPGLIYKWQVIMMNKKKTWLNFLPHLIGQLALLTLSGKSDFYTRKTNYLKKV